MCEEEIELHEELEDAQNEKRAPTRISQNYIAGARKFLAPVLMDTMTKQSDDPEEEGQGICGTAGACLELVTRTVMPPNPHSGPSAQQPVLHRVAFVAAGTLHVVCCGRCATKSSTT